MAKTKVKYVCNRCGYQTSGWLGLCPSCRTYNSFEEETVEVKAGIQREVKVTKALMLSEIPADRQKRMRTGIAEFDRVLGGGIVRGSLVLLSGDPGIGKSTLLLQVAASKGLADKKILYVTGEESAFQLKLRAERLGIEAGGIYILAETELEAIGKVIDEVKPELVVVDSIQTLHSGEIESTAGSIPQIRACCTALQQVAKVKNVAVFIIGHITKEGSIAGPKTLEHIVDAVIYFEGENHQLYRVLRSVKNRFGPANEIGVFEMKQQGLEEVRNPSERLVRQDAEQASGSVVLSALEGSRTILVELQALVTPTAFGMPRRMSAGYDYNRLNMLLAVVEKRLGMVLSTQDVYINVAGGLKIDEPAADLAIIAAVISSLSNISIASRTVVFGEAGLTGELRGVSLAASRVNEAQRLGFTRCILPKDNLKDAGRAEGMKLIAADTVARAVEALW